MISNNDANNDKICNPIFFVVLQRREDEFSELLNHRATFSGFTALMYAAIIENVVAVKLLLESGADPTMENKAGMRARDYATSNPKILQMLKEYEDKVSKSDFSLLEIKCWFLNYCVRNVLKSSYFSKTLKGLG